MPAKSSKRRTITKKPISSPEPAPIPVIPTDAPIASEVLSVPSAEADAPIELTGALANPEESPVEATNRWLYRAGIIGAIGIVVLSIVIWTISQTTTRPTSLVPIPTPEVTVPTVTAAPVMTDKSLWLFEVYNGSGVAGRAGTIAQKLRASGYQVIVVGNADTLQTGSVLRVRPALSFELPRLIQELSSIVPIATSSADLSGVTTASAILTIGR